MRTTIPDAGTMPAPITPALRKTIILAKVDRLQVQEPPAFRSWSYQKIKDFNADVSQLGRLQRGPLGHVLRISGRIAATYGLDMAQIDPCHGEAA